ncbi:PilZ domain-containing protein [Desulfogranum japonicum]|uniref:PilZ domain-containing protein n=1 Tax=Desulfogranum japonicum TaxID=231447 RepID=UPI000403FB9F|nr:PilZ domain-containing protein [Desulfogranum japonicum]
MDNNTVSVKERRKFPRYRVKDGVFAFLGSTPGMIVDISEGGMAIEYIVLNKDEVSAASFDLFSTHQQDYIANIPGATVGEVDVFPSSYFSSFKTTRLSVQFGEMNREQQSKLRYFILQNTIALA